MNSHGNHTTEDQADSIAPGDISILRGILFNSYIKTDHRTGKYFIEVDETIYERFQEYYGSEGGLERFFHIKELEYISLRIIVVFLTNILNKDIRGRLLSIEKDIRHGVDAVFSFGNKNYIEVDLTSNPEKPIHYNKIVAYVPGNTVHKVWKQVHKIMEYREFEDTLAEEIGKICSKDLKIIFRQGQKELNMYNIIEAMKQKTSPSNAPTVFSNDTNIHKREG